MFTPITGIPALLPGGGGSGCHYRKDTVIPSDDFFSGVNATAFNALPSLTFPCNAKWARDQDKKRIHESVTWIHACYRLLTRPHLVRLSVLFNQEMKLPIGSRFHVAFSLFQTEPHANQKSPVHATSNQLWIIQAVGRHCLRSTRSSSRGKNDVLRAAKALVSGSPHSLLLSRQILWKH